MHWLLVKNADEATLNQPVADVRRAVLGSHETLEAFANKLPELGQACGNMHGKERLKMVFTHGLPQHLRVDGQQYNSPVSAGYPAAVRLEQSRLV